MKPEDLIQLVVIVFAGGLLAVCMVVLIQEVIDVRRRRRENVRPILRADVGGFTTGVDKANKSLLRTRRAIAMAGQDVDLTAQKDPRDSFAWEGHVPKRKPRGGR